MLDEKTRRWFARQGRKGKRAQIAKYTPEERSEFARKAWQTKRRMAAENRKTLK